MTLRVLLIEDQAAQRRDLLEVFDDLGFSYECVEVESLSEARSQLDENDFDLVICDMQIPSAPDAADLDTDHGKAAYYHAALVQPGTPRVFFSAFIDLEMIGADLAGVGRDDLFGDGTIHPLAEPAHKERGLDACAAIAARTAEGLEAVHSLTVEDGGLEEPLDLLEQRAVSIYARRAAGSAVHVASLGGLSGSRALRVTVRDAQDRAISRAFVKIGAVGKLNEEAARYTSYVENRLPHGSYAPMTRGVESMLGRRRTLVYSLATAHDRSIFDLVGDDDVRAGRAVERLAALTAEWSAGDQQQFTVGELRNVRTIDAVMSSISPDHLSPDEVARVEMLEVDGPVGLQHGDLHGENVLVDPDVNPLLIDFGDVGRLPVGLDPLVLESSLVFHPRSPFLSSGWPTDDQLENWSDLDSFVVGCPGPAFVRACRTWQRALIDDRVADAILWSHAARQLKYGVVAPQRLAVILRGVAQRL